MHICPVVGADGDRLFEPREESMFVFVDIDFLSFAIQTEGLVAGLDKIHFQKKNVRLNKANMQGNCETIIQ